MRTQQANKHASRLQQWERSGSVCVCVMRAEIYRAPHAHFFNSLQITIEIFSSFMDCNTVVHIEKNYKYEIFWV